ncbi:23S rRNA (uracil(1939)-C(5))-methyltransferase RlmD [Geobacter grbiciae]|uniref:23S rRNA (uracil(1939)-C(5))-methyltransferase RlmD n=1 Tax=Geobacter grbiciae TaxID=155042 RepID=UPI001C018669|nr:23S rRNA (uracil(1939)-C(5))-methyltransferase RlmD [Geobacter grbiciae]MBT1074618.1 23S rRNA (uracil(1939)-C(5))-methyltransferase RlmD [Geobacter grbiciae]
MTTRYRKQDGKRNHRTATGQVVTLTITGFDDEGFGTASHEGKKVLVTGALPGETVSIRVTHNGPRTMFGEAITILSPSPDRMPSPSCTTSSCSNCPLISMNYGAQLTLKRNLVEKEIRSFASLRAVPINDVISSPRPLQYRNSAKLVVAGTFRSPIIGIYRRNSHNVVDISVCPLHHPLINRVVAAVKEGIRKGKVPVYNPRTDTGILRYLVVRVSEHTGRAMAVFVTAQRSYNEIHHLAKFVKQAVPELDVAVQNVNTSEGNVILAPHDHFLTKDHAIIEELAGVRFSISPRSFFQVNSGGARIIYEKVREWSALAGKEKVVDLYCGIGGISLFLAPGAREVHGIEYVDAAVADAERNARLNGIRNCSFEAGDAAELLEELVEEGTEPDVIIFNPPRKGCDRRVLEAAVDSGPGRMIYVSCSPATLARDLDILAGLGYQTREVQPVDMFPQTPHIENVALLVDARHARDDHEKTTSPSGRQPFTRKRRGASA